MDKKTAQRTVGILAAACVLVFLIIALQPPADGWASDGGETVYILDGHPVTGWQDIAGSRYYFSEEGYLCTGWQEIGEKHYYFAADGAMETGWLELGGKQYYLHEDGSQATNWLELDGKQYYLGSDGTIKSGIIRIDGEEYLLSEQGFVSRGWTELGGKRYYGDEDGHPLYGWNQIGGTQYYFEESGAAAAGWLELDGFTYYFYADGSPAQGELTINGETHYFASNGQLLLLVNPWHSLPEDYTVELVPVNDQHQIAAIAYQDLVDMMANCEAVALAPAICSSYRTHEYQEMLYQNRINRYIWAGYSEEDATELAGRSVAVPGTSEHQLGLAVDIVDDNNWRLDESQAEMPTQKWLMENSWRYGWILRYPNEKSEITGIIYEPWHYRYVGKTVAAEIYESGLCLEEYLEMLTNSVG